MHNNDNLYPHLSLPPINAIVRSSNHQMQIFDTYRKIWIPLTPEEWVRQHILNYLIHSLNYPAGRLSIEFSFRYGKRMKRADAVFFSINKHPLVLVECKAPDRVLNQAVFSQIAAYAYVLKTPYLLITNGLQHVFFEIQNQNLIQHQTIPAYQELNQI